MRILIAAMLFTFAIALPSLSAHATDLVADAAAMAMHQQSEVDDNDDTRVEVQVVVLAIVIGAVLVFGTAVYLVRRRLGLVPPPPEQGGDGHH
jgi:uncharacterized membrane protein YczE